MDRRDRTLLYDSGEKGLVPGVELGRHSRRRDIDETVRSLLVEPDHPVPQGLTVHDLWLGARPSALKGQRDGANDQRLSRLIERRVRRSDGQICLGLRGSG